LGTYCKNCLWKYQHQRWKDRKLKAVQLLGGHCAICGYDKCLVALEFHHKDPSQKEMAMNNIVRHNWTRVIEELKKCILLCANCHRETHASSESFLKDRQLNDNSSLQGPKPTGKCPICETDVFGTKYCSHACASQAQRKVARPNREELMADLKGMSFCAIGRKYGVSDKAVCKWKIHYGL